MWQRTRKAKDLSAAELAEVSRRAKRHYRNEVHQAGQATTGDDAAFVIQPERIDTGLIFEVDQIQEAVRGRAAAARPDRHGRHRHVYSCYASASMLDLDQNR